MRNRSHFQRHGGGVFRCTICDRSTRLAGQGNDRICPECWDLAGLENSVLDGVQTLSEVAKERDWLLAKAVKQGSDPELIKAAFKSPLFPTPNEKG